ncbi:hypothetical protein [Bacillus sp. MUM 13]|uniref:hypothetical protein n=1 Tax=Bacillus sp. MUM 13 TaxID=1678001 RepID=UPI00147F1152|nr:hypothetical protein [Bacillus sp. MUM 13]
MIWVIIVVFLLFIGIETGISHWINSEVKQHKPLHKRKEIVHIIKEKFLGKKVS